MTDVREAMADMPTPSLKGPTRPGDCELRISTLQGDGSAEQSLKYKVLAK